MNDSLKKLLTRLINRNYIGGKHVPESKFIIPRVKWLPKNQRKRFDEEYESLVKQGYVLRYKKMTGRQDDWHISLNPGKVDELKRIIKEDEIKDE